MTFHATIPRIIPTASPIRRRVLRIHGQSATRIAMVRISDTTVTKTNSPIPTTTTVLHIWLPAFGVDRGAAAPRQEDVQPLASGVESGGVGALLGRNLLDHRQLPGVDDVDGARLADRDVEPVPPPVQPDRVR